MTDQQTRRIDDTPADLGYAVPAEWDAHRGTWLSWPHNEETWPDELPDVEMTMAHAVRALAIDETVFINVLDGSHERHVRALLDEVGVNGSVRFEHIPTNDAWIRDHGAIFVRNGDGRVAATSWGFNSWGGKYPPFDLDDQVPDAMARVIGVDSFDGGMILEGGSIEVNGDGMLLTTEACLLNPNRNPELSRAAIETRLRAFLGVRDIVWLGDGIVGDDTDGHIDDVTRFVNTNTIVTVVEEDPGDPNYKPLRENLERLREHPATADLTIVPLPMPRPVVSKGERMPASYANFYIGNGVVLLPTFGDVADDDAMRVLSACFPGRRVVPLDCRSLIWGLGAFHCLTQQLPA
jgi:agmatine deiminase